MADKTKRKQVGKSKRAISNEDEFSFQTDITGVINKTNQLNIKIFKDDSVVTKMEGKNTFSQWIDKNGGKIAIDYFLEELDYPNLTKFHYDIYKPDSRWSKICKRDEQMISMNYIIDSLKIAPIIVVATDSDGKIRSFATVGLKNFDGKEHLYIDVLCSCLDKDGYCPTDEHVTRGPGGADIISVLLFIIVSLKIPTKYEGIILNSLLGETEEIYKSLGFKEYGKNEVPTLTTMHYNLSNRPKLIKELRKRIKKNEGNFYFDSSFLRDKKRKREISIDSESSRERKRLSSPRNKSKRARSNSSTSGTKSKRARSNSSTSGTKSKRARSNSSTSGTKSKRVRSNSNDSRNSSSGSIKNFSSDKKRNGSSVGGNKTKRKKKTNRKKRINKNK